MCGSLAMALWPTRSPQPPQPPQHVAVEQARRPRSPAPSWCVALGCAAAIEARQRALSAIERAQITYPRAPRSWWRALLQMARRAL